MAHRGDIALQRQAIQRLLFALAALALVAGVLLLAERGDSTKSGPARLVPVELIVDAKAPPPLSGNPEKHCGNGKGLDLDYNKYCPQPSPG